MRWAVTLLAIGAVICFTVWPGWVWLVPVVLFGIPAGFFWHAEVQNHLNKRTQERAEMYRAQHQLGRASVPGQITPTAHLPAQMGSPPAIGGALSGPTTGRYAMDADQEGP